MQLRFQVVDDLEVVVAVVVVDDLEVVVAVVVVVAEVVVVVVAVVVVVFVVQCNYGGMLDAAITENGVCGNEPDVNRCAISHINGVSNCVSNVVGSEAGGHA